jgi:hypothetical protein
MTGILTVTPLLALLLALPANFRLGWSWIIVTDAIAKILLYLVLKMLKARMDSYQI